MAKEREGKQLFYERIENEREYVQNRKKYSCGEKIKGMRKN